MRICRHVKKLAPYTPGEQPKAKNAVKLNTNENPYPPSPRCAEVLKKFDPDRLRRYPDPVFSELRKELAKLHGAKAENIFVGNGSDEVLAVAARCFVENGEKIGSLDPSYSLYKTLAAIRDVEWRGNDENAALFLLTNPNAPTGTAKTKAEIAAFAKRLRGVLLVDEAYADFARENCMDLATAKGNRNTIVMRTLSKSYSLAGLRLGYCVGPEDLIAAMYKVKDSYNVDAVAQAVALAAVKDQAWMKRNVAKIVKTRERFAAELERRGWDVMPSEANFVFAKPAHRKAAKLFDDLRGRHIYVRYFRGPKTGDRLRVTIGTDREMKKLLKAIDELDI
ncbi:MAG: aminotransferase class I/II-fold pyridoxal phosphate-dependent enzyme [Kiritimatiellae bacterium]|nr:aminotransferase class I/II-fold pyridoxal phosphate-dependent enzyme [Kiritimatiellia bacterium]